MVDEDFVMGYVVGYNDGIGSGGGSEGKYDNIPIYKKYHLIGTDCYIGIADANSDALEIPSSWSVYYDGEDYNHTYKLKWCPTPYETQRTPYLVWFIGSKAVGITAPIDPLSTERNYTAEGPPYGDITPTSVEKVIMNTAEISFNTKTSTQSKYTQTTMEAVFKITRSKETTNVASGEVTVTALSDIQSTILSKLYTVYTNGNRQITTSYNHKTIVNGASTSFDPISAYRDTLQAWFDCTGIEEVTI